MSQMLNGIKKYLKAIVLIAVSVTLLSSGVLANNHQVINSDFEKESDEFVARV